MLLPTGVARATDAENRPVLLFDSEWALKFFRQKHPGVELGQIAPPDGAKLEPSSPEVRPSSQAQGLG